MGSTHQNLVGADDEHLVAVSMGEIGRGVHEGERVTRAGHGLRGGLAPLVGHHRRVVHEAHGDEGTLLPPVVVCLHHPSLGLDRADEGDSLGPKLAEARPKG